MRWVDLGLRGRLALSIAAIVIGAFAVTFFAVYRGTGSALRSRIDRELRTEVDGLTHTVKRPSEEGNALAAARGYISSQPFGPSARLLIVSLPGGPTVTNHPELIGAVGERRETFAEHRRELMQATALHSAPAGFTTLDLTDTGQVRILTRVVMVGRRKFVVRAGEPVSTGEQRPVRCLSDVSDRGLLDPGGRTARWIRARDSHGGLPCDGSPGWQPPSTPVISPPGSDLRLQRARR